MSRPFTDITTAKNDQLIKNGTMVTSTTFTGFYNTRDTYVKNKPDITTIQSKYGYRFYNGLLVQLTDGQTVIGG